MSNKKIKSFVGSHRKSALLSLFGILGVILLLVPLKNIVRANFGAWGDNSLVNVCVDAQGNPTIVSPGSSCGSNKTQSTWLKDVTVGPGLTETRDNSGVTVSYTGMHAYEADASGLNSITPAGGNWADVPDAAITKTFTGGQWKATYTGVITMTNGDGTASVRFEMRPSEGTATDSTQNVTLEHQSSSSHSEVITQPFTLQALLTVPSGTVTIVPQIYSNNPSWGLMNPSEFILEPEFVQAIPVTPTPTSTPTPAPPTISINAGGQTSGNFLADTDETGGSSYTSTLSVDTSAVTNPAPQTVYQSVRYGNFSYTIPNLNPNTDYTVRLHFNELYWGTENSENQGGIGSRVFNVDINGTNVLNNFDIFATAGGADKAIVKPFTATADAQGKITIQFTTVTDNAMVNGIEILQ
jgi:hypothetical protein